MSWAFFMLENAPSKISISPMGKRNHHSEAANFQNPNRGSLHASSFGTVTVPYSRRRNNAAKRVVCTGTQSPKVNAIR
jgi:hypothetical protein